MVHAVSNIYYLALYRKGLHTPVFKVLRGGVPPTGLPPCTIPGVRSSHHSLREWLPLELCSVQLAQLFPAVLSRYLSRLISCSPSTLHNRGSWLGGQLRLREHEHKRAVLSSLARSVHAWRPTLRSAPGSQSRSSPAWPSVHRRGPPAFAHLFSWGFKSQLFLLSVPRCLHL